MRKKLKRKETKKQLSVTVTVTDTMTSEEMREAVEKALGSTYKVHVVYGTVEHEGKTYSHRDYDFDAGAPLPTATAFGETRNTTVAPRKVGPASGNGLSKSEKDANGSWSGARKPAPVAPQPKRKLRKRTEPSGLDEFVAPSTAELDKAATDAAASSATALKKRLTKKPRG